MLQVVCTCCQSVADDAGFHFLVGGKIPDFRRVARCGAARQRPYQRHIRRYLQCLRHASALHFPAHQQSAKCLKLLHANGYQGTLSTECEGQSGPMLETSLNWLRKTLKELRIPEEF